MTHTNGRRRVVVTGHGVVTPLGTGVEKFWAALKKGECGIRQVQSFSTEDLYITIAGEVPDFDPRERLKSKPLLLADKFSQYAGCAAQEAVAMSKLEAPLKDKAAYRAACIIGSGVGGLTTLEFSYKMLFKENKRATHPLTLAQGHRQLGLGPCQHRICHQGPDLRRGERLLDGDACHRPDLPHDPRRPGRSRPCRRGGSLAQLGRDPRLAGDARA